MKIYWYWPHPHRGASPLALAALRPGDTLTVQALPSLAGEQFGGVSEYEVLRDLPDPTAATTFAGRALRPLRLTVRRSRARARALRRGFDVAHIQTLVYQSDWLDLARLRRRTPLVSVVHDVRPHDSPLPSRVRDAFLRRLYAVAGRLVVYHDTLKEELCADFGVEPDRVHVLPLPISGADERDARVKKPDRPLVLFFGVLRRNKGIDVLLEAIRAAGPELDADVVIAGAGDADLERTVREHARQLPSLSAEIGFVDQQRKRQLFSQATCVVLPYDADHHSHSGILRDAYSYRVPLVATDVGALGPTVRADETGLVVPPRRPAELAAAIASLAHRAADDEIEQRMEAAVLRHNHAVVGPQLRAVYDAALGERQ